MKPKPLPTAFIHRRLHSLTGVFIVLFLFEHLLTNSEAALWIGEDGKGFIRMVQFIHSLPYLNVIEVMLLGVPIVYHAILGVSILFSSKQNSWGGKGESPLLQYGRNKAYTWQRITSWILLVFIVVHVVEMRFLHYPTSAAAAVGQKKHYMVKVSMDEGLITVAERLGVSLYGADEVKNAQNEANLRNTMMRQKMERGSDRIAELKEKQRQRLQQEWIQALTAHTLAAGQVVAVADGVGTAILLTVRDTFKSLPLCLAYSAFVLAAAFHAANGLWTALITWGISITQRAQDALLKFTHGVMLLLAFLGLVSIWGTYWLNLYA